MDSYTSWLKRTKDCLFEAGGTYWRRYHHALVPASLRPEPLDLNEQDARKLLDKSGALFLRYFSRWSAEPTAFWYMACDDYNFANLPQKHRTHIRRGHRECRVERVDPEWLAENGYACYLAAYSGYQKAQAESKAEFDDMCKGSAGGPFEFWAAFVGHHLAGFAKCAVGHDHAASLVFKVDPQYLRRSLASALQDTILTSYVAKQRKTVYAGFRNVVHRTNSHEFLLKFGYRRVYCDLRVVYRPAVKACVKLLYPFRALIERAPHSGLTGKIIGMLDQEEIRRSFGETGTRTLRACPD